MKRSIVAAALLAGVGLIGLGVAMWPKPDEEAIAAQLERLAKAVGVDADESPVFRASRIQGEFVDLFEKDVRVRIPELSDLRSGRRELGEVATRAGLLYRRVSVAFDGVDVQIDASRAGAHVEATAKLTATGNGELREDDRRVHLDWSKTKGDWKISSVAVDPKPPAP